MSNKGDLGFFRNRRYQATTCYQQFKLRKIKNFRPSIALVKNAHARMALRAAAYAACTLIHWLARLMRIFHWGNGESKSFYLPFLKLLIACCTLISEVSEKPKIAFIGHFWRVLRSFNWRPLTCQLLQKIFKLVPFFYFVTDFRVSFCTTIGQTRSIRICRESCQKLLFQKVMDPQSDPQV